MGALAVDRGAGYYVTAGTVSGSNGDNNLYSIDLYTGEQRFIGSLGDEACAGFGIGALARQTVPAPAAAVLFLLGGGLAVARRQRRARSHGALSNGS